MKSKEFITEDNGKKIVLLTHEQISLLQKNCSYYLNSVEPDKVLWRGMRNITDLFGKKKIRMDRMPRDSDPVDVVAFNYLFEKMTNIPLIRNSSTFTTFRKGTAKTYGVPNLVFPLNGTKYISSKVSDLYGVMEKIMSTEEETIRMWLEYSGIPDNIKDEVASELEERFDKVEVISQKATVDRVNEIFGDYVKVWYEFTRPLKSIVSEFTIANTLVSIDPGSQREILLYGQPSYYYVNAEEMIARANIGFNVFVGNQQIRNGLDVELIIQAVKYNQEIYLIKRPYSNEVS